MPNDNVVLPRLGEYFDRTDDQVCDSHDAVIGRCEKARKNDCADKSSQPDSPAQRYGPDGASEHVPVNTTLGLRGLFRHMVATRAEDR